MLRFIHPQIVLESGGWSPGIVLTSTKADTGGGAAPAAAPLVILLFPGTKQTMVTVRCVIVCARRVAKGWGGTM